MKRTADTYREYLTTGQEYVEKIVFLEEKVHQLEQANKILNEFALNASNIIFKMDCLLVKKGEKISSLMEEIESLSAMRELSDPENVARPNSESQQQIKLEFFTEDDVSETKITRTESSEAQIQDCGDGEKNPEIITQEIADKSPESTGIFDVKMEAIDEDFDGTEVINCSNSDLRIDVIDYDSMELNETVLTSLNSNGSIPDIRRAFKMMFHSFLITPGCSLAINFLKTYLSAFVINLGSQKLDLKTNEGGLFMCPKENCPYTSVHITHVKDHFKTHSGEQPFQCKICLMKFKYKQSCKG